MVTLRLISIVLFSTLTITMLAQSPSLKMYIDVKAAPHEVWKKFTTVDGAQTFWAPKCILEPRPNGYLEIQFFPERALNERGTGSLNFLALEENKLVSFTWDAPTMFPEVRKQRTVVVVTLDERPQGITRVYLAQYGWGFGKEWVDARNYFKVAWGEHVLPKLKYSLEHKAIDWRSLPEKDDLVSATMM